MVIKMTFEHFLLNDFESIVINLYLAAVILGISTLSGTNPFYREVPPHPGLNIVENEQFLPWTNM